VRSLFLKTRYPDARNLPLSMCQPEAGAFMQSPFACNLVRRRGSAPLLFGTTTACFCGTGTGAPGTHFLRVLVEALLPVLDAADCRGPSRLELAFMPAIQFNISRL